MIETCYQIVLKNELLPIAEITSFFRDPNIEKKLGSNLNFSFLFEDVDNRIISKLNQYHGIILESEPAIQQNSNLSIIFSVMFENMDYFQKFTESLKS